MNNGTPVSPRLMTVHERLKNRFGDSLHVSKADTEWLSISVSHLTPGNLFNTLFRDQKQLFPEGTSNYAILCPSAPKNGDQIDIHDLSGMARLEYQPGFCYY